MIYGHVFNYNNIKVTTNLGNPLSEDALNQNRAKKYENEQRQVSEPMPLACNDNYQLEYNQADTQVASLIETGNTRPFKSSQVKTWKDKEVKKENVTYSQSEIDYVKSFRHPVWNKIDRYLPAVLRHELYQFKNRTPEEYQKSIIYADKIANLKGRDIDYLIELNAQENE